MIDSSLTSILLTALTYGLCGSLVGGVMRLLNRSQAGPRIDQAAAVGFLVGGAFGAIVGMFRSLIGGS